MLPHMALKLPAPGQLGVAKGVMTQEIMVQQSELQHTTWFRALTSQPPGIKQNMALTPTLVQDRSLIKREKSCERTLKRMKHHHM